MTDWTRDDLPTEFDDSRRPGLKWHPSPELMSDLAAWLNEHYPKPVHPMDPELARLRRECDGARRALVAKEDEAVRECHTAYRERDAAVARAEAAEKRHTWPKVTPTGHTYVEPRTYEALRHEHGNAAQAAIESWDADECPPEPTWEMVGIAHREVERIRRERDAAVARAEAHAKGATRSNLDRDKAYGELTAMTNRAEAAERVLRERDEQEDDATRAACERAEQAERQRDEWKARAEAAERSRGWFRDRAEAAEARTAPAVTKHDIEKVVADWVDDAPEIVNEVWSLVSGSDPAVYVVRESDIAAVKVERGARKWIANGEALYDVANGPDGVREQIGEYLTWVADAEAVARAIEAEQAVDPIMSVIRDGLNVWGTTDEGVRQIAESVRRAISNDGGENVL